MNKSNSKNSYGAYGIILTVIVLLTATFINLLFSLLPDSIKRIDISTEKLTEVSDAAKKHLSENLDSNVYMYLVTE